MVVHPRTALACNNMSSMSEPAMAPSSSKLAGPSGAANEGGAARRRRSDS
jgi:hypothetical protein